MARNVKLSTKLYLGFGVVLLLVLVVAGMSLWSVDGLLTASHDYEGSANHSQFMTEKETDHLKWINAVQDLFVKNLNALEVQMDPTKCGLGKFLYGPEAKAMAASDPKLAALLEEIKEPHRHLHESAEKINQAYRQNHPGLALTLAERLGDHQSWAGAVARKLAEEASGINVYQAEVRNVVQMAMSIIEAVAKDPGLGDEAARQARAKEIIKDIRYGEGGREYVWINDLQPRMVMHPIKPELDGQDMSGNKDPDGKYLFKEFVKVCSEQGSGFVTYKWPKPGADKPVPKVSFVSLYKPWGWIVGTGVYLDETRPALLKRADDFAAGRSFSLGVEMDPSECAFGKWLAGEEARKLMAEWPEFAAVMTKVRKHHDELHHSAKKIEDAASQEARFSIYTKETLPALEEVARLFGQAKGLEASRDQGQEQAHHVFEGETLAALSATQGKLKAIIETLAGQKKAAQETMQATGATAQWTAILVTGIGILVGVLLSVFLTRSITKPISRVISGLTVGSDQVAAASSQVSASSQSLAEGASEQAASLEETSSSMEEMSSMTKANADNTGQADGLMKDSKHIVAQAGQAMSEMAQSMAQIAEAGGEISKIVKSIDEIAFQTNLLALNAAVEAARAGEAGMGFAVVADEVRALAMRAADAAKNTQALVEDTVRRINQGSELVTKTQEGFSQIAESSDKVAALISEVAAASGEQSQGIDQINQAMSQMDRVVQQTAANAEEGAAAAEEMNAQADQMKGYVSQLAALVGGKNGHQGSKAALKAPQKKRLLPAPKGGQKAGRAGAREVQPEEVIPLEESSDLSDF